MPIATAIQLIAQFGLPLTQQLLAWQQSGKTTVTAEDFVVLEKLAAYRSADALAAAGIKIKDGEVVKA